MVSQAAQPHPILPPNGRMPAVDEKGFLTQPAMSMMTQLWSIVNGCSLIVPCSTGGSVNSPVLTPLLTSMLPSDQPGGIVSYTYSNTWCWTATSSSTSPVTGRIANLPLIKVYVNNGLAQADSGDIVTGFQYFWTFVDSLDGGNGGFVQR